MHIPSYQIHNVLNTYSAQLFKACLSEIDQPSGGSQLAELQMVREVQRRALVDKIAIDIVQRITRLDSLTSSFSASGDIPSDSNSTDSHFDAFVFNMLDTRNQKIVRTLSVENSIFLIQRNPT
jgi:hypothetical protein